MSITQSIQDLVNIVILTLSENPSLSLSGLPGFILIGASLYEILKTVLKFEEVGFGTIVKKLLTAVAFISVISLIYNSPKVIVQHLPIQTSSRTKDVVLDTYNNFRGLATYFAKLLQEGAGIDVDSSKGIEDVLMARARAIQICDQTKISPEEKKACFKQKKEEQVEKLNKELDEIYKCETFSGPTCEITAWMKKNINKSAFMYALGVIASMTRLLFGILMAFYYSMSTILAYLAIKILLPALVYQPNREEIKGALKQFYSIALVPAVIAIINYITNVILTLMVDLSTAMEGASMGATIVATVFVGILCLVMIVAEALISLKANKLAVDLLNFKLDSIVNLADTAKDAVMVAGSILSGVGIGVSAIANVVEASSALKNDASDEFKKKASGVFSPGAGSSGGPGGFDVGGASGGGFNGTNGQQFASGGAYSDPYSSGDNDRDGSGSVNAHFRGTPEPMFDPHSQTGEDDSGSEIQNNESKGSDNYSDENSGLENREVSESRLAPESLSLDPESSTSGEGTDTGGSNNTDATNSQNNRSGDGTGEKSVSKTSGKTSASDSDKSATKTESTDSQLAGVGAGVATALGAGAMLAPKGSDPEGGGPSSSGGRKTSVPADDLGLGEKGYDKEDKARKRKRLIKTAGSSTLRTGAKASGLLLRMAFGDDSAMGDMKRMFSDGVSWSDKESQKFRDNAINRTYKDKEVKVDATDENFSTNLNDLREQIHVDEEKLTSLRDEYADIESQLEEDSSNEELLKRKDQLDEEIKKQEIKFEKESTDYQDKKNFLITNSENIDLSKDNDGDTIDDATNLYNLLADPDRITDPEIASQLRDPFSYNLKKLSEMKTKQASTLYMIQDKIKHELLVHETVSNSTREQIELNKKVLGYKNVKDLEAKINRTIISKKRRKLEEGE